MTGKPSTPCCAALQTACMTREDILDSDFPEADPGADYQPVVEWVDYLRCYSIGHWVILHCPWCGKRLPDPVDALEKKSGVWVEHHADGRTSATVDGQPVDDAQALLAQLKIDTEGQD
jgi:hypothetical protein